MSWRPKRFGPLRYFRVKHTGGISAWWKGHDNSSWGFEWGYRDDMRGNESPIIQLRIGKLMALYVEFHRNDSGGLGWELWLLGWWSIR